MTGRIFLKLITAVVCILVVALAAVDYFASSVAERTYVKTLTQELAEKGKLVALVLQDKRNSPSVGDFQAMAKAIGGRLTMVARDGKVILESEATAALMENHGTRPEIVEALAGRMGSSVRASPTLGKQFLYVAQPAPYGVLRLAVPLADLRMGLDTVWNQMLTAVALAFLPAVLLAAFFARYVSRRLATIIDYAGKLAEGRFEERLKNPGNDELGILEDKLNETGEKLQRAIEQLQREHNELEKLERVRKDFVINVSHELRTPLASIQGYTETLLDGALSDPKNNVKFLSIIRTNAERLGRLTADLLTLSRIELKTQKFQFASYYANALVEQSIDSIRPLADRKDLRLAREAAPEGTEIFCDSEAVHQILSNLLENAIKYTPEGGVITVGVKRTFKPGFYEIYVRDTGIGIPAEDLPRLFERFYRVDKARSRELGGTGLGLAIVKHLARSMGGEAGVESRVGEGSSFWFTLPEHDLGLSESEPVQGQLTVS
ncbi:MAG: HAMP domain-containing protein [Acidobacteria bacterium]|nr:HAMP domain-containing protein [Acidobacteriota bacterium]